MHITDRMPGETGRDYALRTLKDNIIRLELEPGSMVSENELASAMSLSRTPVREALIELSKVNIVEIYPQKGSRISQIDPRMVEQAYFMRETLELNVVRELCRTASEEDLNRLRESIKEQEKYFSNASLESGQDQMLLFMDLDNDFHQLFYEITGKEMVYSIIQEIVIHFDRVRNLTLNFVKPDYVIKQHREILEAIEDRDEYLAAALLRRHLNRFKYIQQELLDEHPSYFKVA